VIYPIEKMKYGSVLVDLAAETGGNVEGTELDRIVTVSGVKIVGYGENLARLVEDRPTIISLTPGHPISMRPLEEGDLEKYARHPPKSKPKIICP